MGWINAGGSQHLLKDKEDINENIVQNHQDFSTKSSEYDLGLQQS